MRGRECPIGRAKICKHKIISLENQIIENVSQYVLLHVLMNE